jgi:phosphate-selective porin OprO and OprP
MRETCVLSNMTHRTTDLQLSEKVAPAFPIALIQDYAMRLLRWILCVCVLTCTMKAEAADSWTDLRQRVETLEQQNQGLLELLSRQRHERPNHSPEKHSPEPSEAILPPPSSEFDGASDFLPLEMTPFEMPPTETTSLDESWDNPLGMTATWNHGLEFMSRDGAFRIHIGGRTQFDAAWFAADRSVQETINIPYGNGVDFRRARLRADGTMHETIEWAVEYDFVNSSRAGNVTNDGFTDFDVTGLTDMWWTFTQLPGGMSLRIGNQKEPIGFEHLVSSRFLPFMERSFNQDTFYGGSFNGFTPGISLFNNYGNERGLWHIGLYKPTDNVFAFNTNSGDYAVTGRLTHLPWYADEGRELLHLGASARISSTVNGQTRFRTRDAIRSGVSSTWPVPADTGILIADHQQFLNAELVGIHGPWTIQSEYLVAFVQDVQQASSGATASHATYHGGYVQVLYFLTGESDHYNRRTAALERVLPFRDAVGGMTASQGGRGAWQVGARYNYLDLNSQGLAGGILNNYVLGLNWFLNPNMKLQFDYSATDRRGPLAGSQGDGWVHAWGTRVAHDF